MAGVLIMGNGGIGSALEQVVAEHDDVFLLGRTTKSINIPDSVFLDIEKPESFQSIAEFVVHTNIKTVVNTIGVLHDTQHTPEKTLSQLNEAWFLQSMETNCLPTLMLLQQLQNVLSPKTDLKFVALSARVGSISDNRLGGWMSYRVSKAALNMGLKTVAIEWKYKFKQAVIAGYHPGTVDTTLSKPFQTNVKNLFSPRQAAEYLYEFIESMTPSMSGGVYDWQKKVIPF